MKFNSVYIYIHTPTQQIPYIKKKLLRFFNPAIIIFCEDIDKANIVITSNILEINKTCSVFYLNNVFDDSLWKKIILCISHKSVAN